ncbi:MAG: hypothetical protein PHX78_04215 [bacterium]|nr:hypothetical protein [bacterium]
MTRSKILPALFLLFFSAAEIYSEGISIGTGARFNLNNGILNIPSHLSIKGKLALSTGTINIGGNWANSGEFSPGTGRVNFIDGKSPVNISGESRFYNFRAITNTGKQINFEGTKTQSIINELKLNGTAANLLVLRSTAGGSQAKINLEASGNQDIDYVDVKDNSASGQYLAKGEASLFHSINAGNNLRWFTSIIPLVVSPDSASVNLNETLQFSATGGKPPYTWSVNDTSIAVISSSGILTPVIDPKTAKDKVCTITVRDSDNNQVTTGNITIIYPKPDSQPKGNIDTSSPGSANRVDGYDLYLLARAFGSGPQDSNWNLSADLDANDIVDGNDLIILGSNFGK